MRLLQRVGGVLPGKRKLFPEERDAQPAGSAWAAFAQADDTPQAAPVSEPEPEPEPAEPSPATPEPEPVIENPPVSPDSDVGEIPDLMALLPPELRQRPSDRASPDLPSAGAPPRGSLSPTPDRPATGATQPDPEAFFIFAEPLGAPRSEQPTAGQAVHPQERSPSLTETGEDDPQVAPASSLAALLADSFAQLEQARSARAPEPPDLLAEDIADPEPAALPPPQQQMPAPSGLAAFLADGFRQLDAATAPEARPAASIPSDPPPAPVRAEPPVRAADPPPVQVSSDLPPNPSLAAAAEIAGLIGVALVDSETGVLLASLGGGLDPVALATLSTQVMRAEQEAIGRLRLDDRIEDVLVTMRRQIHLVRPLRRAPSVFLYLALDRRAANLGMARLQLERIEGGLAT